MVWRVFATILVMVAPLGCSASLAGMHLGHPPDARYRAPDGEGLLVIAVDEKLPGDVAVVDGDTRFVANLRDQMHTSVTLAPGRHSLFFLMGRVAIPVLITVEAGRTYLVNAEYFRHKTYGRTVTRTSATPLRAGDEGIDDFAELLRGLPYYEVDQAAGDAWSNQNRVSIRNRVATARSEWSELDEADRAEQTIAAEDGLTPEDCAVFAGSYELP